MTDEAQAAQDTAWFHEEDGQRKRIHASAQKVIATTDSDVLDQRIQSSCKEGVVPDSWLRRSGRIGRLTAISALSLGVASTAMAGPFDGTLRGAYTCGPNVQKGARMVQGFSTSFELTIDGSVLTGAPSTTDTVESFSGEVSKSGLASLKLEGHWTNEPSRAWVSRFSGTITGTNGVLLGAMYTQDGATRLRDCALSFSREPAATSGTRSAEVTPEARRRVDEPLPSSPPSVAIAPTREPAKTAAPAMPIDAWLGTVPPLFVTKKDMLAAALRGDLSGIDGYGVREDTAEGKALIASVAYILAGDYKTPVPNERNGSYCISALQPGIFNAIVIETGRYTSTLSDTPPAFISRKEPAATNRLEVQIAGLRSACSRPVLGRREPYPSVDSFASLLAEYGEATKQFVEGKRAQMVAAYQAELKRKQEAAVAAEAGRRDALQRQIDSERKRIEDEQQRKRQRDANRISG